MAQKNLFINVTADNNATATTMISSVAYRRADIKFSDDLDYKDDEPMPWETIAETDDIQELDFSHS